MANVTESKAQKHTHSYMVSYYLTKEPRIILFNGEKIVSSIKDVGDIHMQKIESRDFPGIPMVKNSPANAGTWVWSLVWESPHASGQLSL